MRTLWIIVSTLAVANLLALAGFVGWLVASDRLDQGRLERIRTVLSTTIAQEEALAEEQAAEEERTAARQAALAKAQRLPLTSEQALALADTFDQLGTREIDRLDRQAQDLRRTLAQEQADLDQRRDEFAAEVRAFEERRARILELEGSEQFRKAVRLYQTLKAPVAKDMMQTLLREGEQEQVVAYLDALSSRAASKIIAEFEREDPAVAADLLERLRVRGLQASAAEDP